MPMLEDRRFADAPLKQQFSVYDEDAPTALEAAFQTENVVGSFLTDPVSQIATVDQRRVDPDYSPFDDPEIAENPLGKQALIDGSFDDVHNKTMATAMLGRLDRDQKARQSLAASGWVGAALSMGAGIVDLPTILPGGALVRGGQVGYSAVRSAAVVGAAAGAGAAVQEAGLQATQELRTGTESAINIGGSVILGGLIGTGAAKFLTRGEWSRVGDKLLEEVESAGVTDSVQVSRSIVNEMQSAGAAAAEKLTAEQLGVGGPKAAEIVANATAAARINPGVQTMLSPSPAVRRIYNEMVDNPIYTRMNMEGETLGAGAENLMKRYERGVLSTWMKEAGSLYKEARKAGYKGTRADFMTEVGRAGRRLDRSESGNDFVTRAAQSAREKMFDPLLRAAQDAGLLPADVNTSTAASYVSRLWNRNKIVAKEPEFKKVLTDWLDGQLGKIPEAEKPDFISKADQDAYVEEIANSVINKLTGRGVVYDDLPDWIIPVKRGPLAERTLSIPDALVEDYLESDMEAILRRYARVMSADVELTKKFGSPDMKKAFDDINADYEDLRAKVTDEKELSKLSRAQDRDIKNLSAFRDMLRGTYRAGEEGSNWSKLTRGALTWNYIRLLGGVTLSSMSDMSRFIGVHGMRATMREALPALVGNLKAAQISRTDARELGAVVETVLNSRLASMAELTDPYAYGSAFERFMSNSSRVFSKLTGLTYWNDGMKTIASVMTQNRMMRNSLNWQAAGKRERAYMAYLGINEGMAERIAAQYRKYGIQENGIYGANVSRWDDPVAVDAWAAALNKDVDRTIVTKGVADSPLWMKTNTGKLIMQFKSFGLASHQRVLIAGLQERPQRLAEQMVFATTLGMLISYLKFIERGSPDEAQRLTENPGLWIANGLDRSGILSIPFEISNTMDKLGLDTIGGVPITITSTAQAIADDPDKGGTVSRYASRNALGSVLGPTAGIFEDLRQISDQLTEGDLKRSGANAMFRQMPGATLPGVRSVIGYGVKPAISEAVD